MKAIQLTESGETEALAYESVSPPEPDDDELLVRIHAAGVNPLDWLICRGILPELRDKPLPWIPGWDLSGVVHSVGERVKGFKPQDAVFGMVRLPGAGGTFAEYTTVTVDEITAKPSGLSHTQAAGLPMAGQTAFHALYEAGELDAGQRVLIHAAAGGVGHLAVQFAASAGAYVIGTASDRNERFLRNLGVDEFVNYREQRFENVVEDVDVVIDAIGGEVVERSVEVVRSGGVVVTLPDQPPADTIERFQSEYNVTVRFFDVLTESDPATLNSVATGVERGVVDPTVSATYPLSEAQKALEVSADGHVRGKLVLNVTNGKRD